MEVSPYNICKWQASIYRGVTQLDNNHWKDLLSVELT